MAAKAALPSELWAVLPGLASIPGTLGTKRLINRGRGKKRVFYCAKAQVTFLKCALFKIFQWISTSLRIISQFPMLAFM